MLIKIITLRNIPYVRVCYIKKLCVIEITEELKEFIRSYNKSCDNLILNIKCGFSEYIELTDKIGTENNKPVTYKVEIEGNEKEVFIGVAKDSEKY